MIGDISLATNIYIITGYTGYTDLRQGIDGLAGIIKHQYGLDPFDHNSCEAPSLLLPAFYYETNRSLYFQK